MEQPDEEIKTISFTETTVEIIYANDISEIITKDSAGYKKLYDAWLVQQPMFISDIYKMQMRDLTFAARNTIPSVLQMNKFLSEARAITNIIGNGVATLVIAKSEKEFDAVVYAREIEKSSDLIEE